MKDFLEIEFDEVSSDDKDILIALLDHMGYDSFHETDSGLRAYILESDFEEDALKSMEFLQTRAISYSVDRMEHKNWNEEWETNYDPIAVDKTLYIRAPFHPEVGGYELQLQIIPKMSFGTGHHQTTRLMARLLLDLDIKDKSVLDMGTGTGILAIICEKKGAAHVDAIDNFDWAVENTRENAEMNSCSLIAAEHGDAGLLHERSYDVVVANINRNVLLEDIKHYRKTLASGGLLLLSGFFEDDLHLIEDEVKEHGGELVRFEKEDRWMACKFKIK